MLQNMSQAKIQRDNVKINNALGFPSKQKLKKGKNFASFNKQRPYKDFHYTKYNFRPQWAYHRRKHPYQKSKTTQNEPERPPSPFSGTEEYTLRKIQETSDMIKKRLMMPLESDDFVEKPRTEVNTVTVTQNITSIQNGTSETERNPAKSSNKKSVQYDVDEIHEKIITHITKLSHGKKMNLICSTSSGYDIAIQQIQKQKRIELSKVLREMCSSHQTVESGEVINAIIPDIGIKIEELPLEVIQELSNTLDINFDKSSCLPNSETITHKKKANNIKKEVIESMDDVVYIEPNVIKKEVIEIMDNEINNDVMQIKHEVVNIKDEIFEENDSPIITPDIDMERSNVCVTENATHRNCTFTVSSQTEVDCISVSTQTTNSVYSEANNVSTLDEGVQLMLKIDEEMKQLTELRQSIFLKLQENNVRKKKVNKSVRKTETNKDADSSPKIQIHTENVRQNPETDNTCNYSHSLDTFIQERDVYYDQLLDFSQIVEKILVIKIVDFEDTVLAASESGKIYFINTLHGAISRVLTVSKMPITSLCYWITGKKKQPHLLVGSLDTQMREYDYHTHRKIRLTTLTEKVQCMEQAWDYIFIGTTNGSLLRYSLQMCKLEFEEKISKESILVLKVALEGSRRVLLVGSRNTPVCVRDAMSALHLRTMNDFVTPTVYSLVLENSMVYCATPFHDILVFSFHVNLDGTLIHKFEATNSKGISCLKVVGNLLFASCYNGNIYVFNIKTHKHVGVIEGPGGVILSMEVLKNIVIVGTMSLKFKSLIIPYNILQYN